MFVAARECMAEIERLHRRWRRLHPKEARAIHPRTFQTVYTLLRKGSRELGRAPAVVDYLPEEKKLMGGCAQAVVEGRYPSVADATRAAWPKFERLWATRKGADKAGLARTFGGVSQHVCILTRRLGRPRPETGWFPAEDKVIDRFARRVLAGDYSSVPAAAPDCRAELGRLADSTLRTPEAVSIRLRLRLRQLGRHGRPRFPWSKAERLVAARWARRHNRTVEAGTPWMVSDTIAMLRADMRQRGLRVRSPESCRHALGRLKRCHGLAATVCGQLAVDAADERTLAVLARFRAAQRPILERHAAGILSDPRHDISAATRRCQAELAELAERTAEDCPGVKFKLRWQTFKTVHTLLRRRARELGLPVLIERFSPAVDRLVLRYTRAYLEGRYERISAAGRACLAALTRLHRTNPSRYPDVPRRRLHSICGRIDRRVIEYGLPHPASSFSAEEMLILDKYARRVAEGKHKGPLPAARRCYDDLTRLWRRAASRIRPRLRRYSGRSFGAVYQQLALRARDFGYRGVPHRRWLPAERRIAAKWLRRYIYYRDSDTPWSITDTANSLQEDLASSGYERTLEACRGELLLESWGRIAPDKFEG